MAARPRAAAATSQRLVEIHEIHRILELKLDQLLLSVELALRIRPRAQLVAGDQGVSAPGTG